jgi:hypothetical protein
MPSLIASKQHLKHYLKMFVVLLIFAGGFMFSVVETMGGRYGVEMPEIQKPAAVSMVEVATGCKAPGLTSPNIGPLP